MAQPAFSSVDAYLDAQPPAPRRILRRVRTVLRQALPTAEESISYKIPTYTLPGGPVIYFAGWKDHLSLYPVSEQLISQLADAVAAPLKKGKLQIEKGTLRIPYAESLPVHLISHLAQLRAKQVAGKATAQQKRRAGTAEKPAAKSAATQQRAPRAKGSTPPSTAAKARGARATRSSAGKAKPAAASAASASRTAAKAKPSATRAASTSRTAAKVKPSAASASRSSAKTKPSAAKRR